MSELTLGSLFDGSGGFPLGAILSGIEPMWASEIEPFPIRVTTKRMPCVEHLGDISALSGKKIRPVDIITFGSPCQDMSVAGKRNGLDGSRSSLFYEAIRIIKEMREATDGKYPRFIVWENVPGAFSSNNGEDFKAVLEAVCGIKNDNISIPKPKNGRWTNAGEIMADGFSVAWRVLDAQYWGVPQRRKRIYLVADFDAGCAGKVLFESEGLSGYSSKGFIPWQRTARSSEKSVGTAGGNDVIILNDQGGDRMDTAENITATLRAEAHHPPCVVAAGFCTEHSAKAHNIGYEEEIAPTLRHGTVPATVANESYLFETHAQDSRYTGPHKTAQTVLATFGTGGNNQPFVVESPKTLKIRSGCEGGGKGALVQDNLSATLSCNNDQTVFVPFCKTSRPHSPDDSPTWIESKTANTLNTFDVGETRCNELAVKAYGICSKESNSMKSENPASGFYETDTSRTLDCNGGNPNCNQGGIAVVCVDQGGGKSSCNYSEEVSPTLSCTHGGEPAVCIQGSAIGRDDKNGPNGSGVNEEVSFTLDSTDRHAVAYGLDRATFNQGRNAQYNFEVSEDVQPTMVARGPGAVAQPASFYPQMKAESQCFRDDGINNTLVNGTNPGHQNAVVIPAYSSSKASFFTSAEEELANTLVATDYKDPPLVNEATYIVRRLMPVECARLQGFPDWWCHDLGTENPTEEEISFWTNVFETHRNITGTAQKPKSRSQIEKWLKSPHSDSAEYKMWGNGVALPCVCFVLSGIKYFA